MTRSESDRQTKCCIICMYWKHRTVCSIFACLCTFFYAIATSIQTFYLYYVCFFFFLFSFCCYCFHLFCFTSLFPQFTWKQHRYRYYCHNFINIKLYKRYTHTHTHNLMHFTIHLNYVNQWKVSPHRDASIFIAH